MNVLDAITSRKSIRAFRPDPVPKDTIDKILQVSQRAPSGTNTQPWHVHVCTGTVKQAITDDVLALVRSGGGEKYARRPPTWTLPSLSAASCSVS